MASQPALDIAAVRQAAERIAGVVHRTPVMRSRYFDETTGATVFFKCENFQKVGAFKFRGATNAVLSLPEEEARRGVVTHSSGNHAQALALAARMRDIPATIVMPRNAPAVKCAAVAGYGAEIVECEPTVRAREETAAEVVRRTGGVFIHPYNDPRIIAGQGTAALELLDEVPDLDVILAPVGGGGLLSGTAITGKATRPGVQVLGAEPTGADDAQRSLAAGRILPSDHPQTIADGLRTSLGELTFDIIRRLVDEIITVDDAATMRAMRQVWERMKIVVEPSAAVPVAVLLENARIALRAKRVGIILGGGNVDADAPAIGRDQRLMMSESGKQTSHQPLGTIAQTLERDGYAIAESCLDTGEVSRLIAAISGTGDLLTGEAVRRRSEVYAKVQPWSTCGSSNPFCSYAAAGP